MHRAIAYLTLFALLAGCGAIGTVRVALKSGDPVTENIRSFRFVVAAEGAVPQLFGPLPRENTSAKLDTDVPLDVRFFIDVFGCPDSGRCDPELAIARGCTDVTIITADIPTRDLDITLVDAAASDCPPEF